MGICSSTPSAPFDYDAQLRATTSPVYSVIVNPSDNPTGETHSRRHPEAVNGLCTSVYPNEPQPVNTIWEGFQRGVRLSSSSPCFGTRPFLLSPSGTYLIKDGFTARGDFVWSTYADVDAESREVGIGLACLGYESQANIGIFSKNRHEWLTTALGLLSRSMRIVALYDTLGNDAIRYVIEHSETTIVFVSAENMPALIKVLDGSNIRHIVQYDVRDEWKNVEEIINPQHVETLAAKGIQLLSYSKLREMGRADTSHFPALPKRDDVSYIMYTSGTTGNPKGAILTHGGICSSVEASRSEVPMTTADIHLSYLPLAHIYEAGVVCVALFAGARIGFFSGVVKKMTEDLASLRPTIFFGVPRVYQRIYQVVFANINAAGGLKKRLALNAYESQVRNLREGKDIRGAFLPEKIFGAIRTRVGLDRCQKCVTGAAPCPPYIMEFIQVVVGCGIIQGYGLTETHAVVAGSKASDHVRGHVGGPMRCSEVKLVDIPDMNYLSTDKPLPRGEIWVRGPQLFKGYYKDDANTAEALKGEWLATGDVGRWNTNGSLSIIDRKKNIFKLSQGEYIAAEHIEAIYAKSAAITAIFVYGNSFKSFLLGIVTPAVDYWIGVWKERGWWDDSVKVGEEAFPQKFAEVWVAHEAQLKQELVATLVAQQKELKGFEVVKDWLIEYHVDREGNAFTPANGLMTPTFKVRRQQLLQAYVRPLKEMYGKLGEPVSSDEHWPGE